MTLENLVYGYVVDEHSYPDKSPIIEENSIGDWLYVVLEGRVKVKKKVAKGTITLSTMGKGSIFGEIPLFLKTNKVRMATVEALGPVRVGVLDTTSLNREIEALSPQLRGLLKALAGRFTETVERISRIAAER
ncbi:MAG: cyclic nucleotide-binding domain-containing protein [Desulfobacteraceae bacterium]